MLKNNFDVSQQMKLLLNTLKIGFEVINFKTGVFNFFLEWFIINIA